MPKRVGSRRVAAAGLIVCCAACANASAQSPSTLPGVVVVGQRQPAGTPGSIDSVRADAVPARARLSVSEWLGAVPGVAAHDRQNLAQDVQLTVRGFGARSTFGVRGLQVFVDGIPATMPDGQGQVSHVPLAALARVEILRGPFSALYGNASGGVIEFSSSDPPPRADAGLHVAIGSDAMVDASSWVGGPWTANGDGGFRIDADRLELGGYREHSRARRDIAQARLLATARSGARVALTLNGFDLRADDPQGLTREQAEHSPRMASAGAIAFDTRKRARQEQAGLRVEQAFGDRNRVTLSAWSGTRTTFQMLSVPVAAQAAPGSGGGVVDLARDYNGADLRWRGDTMLGGHPASLTLGVESQQSREHRRGFENFVGAQLGVVGALRRDQRDSVASHDAYAEARWMFRTHWTATLGMRRSRVDFDSRDAYIAAGNPDDSGALRYRQTTPVAGLLYQPIEGLEVYANAGRGFETPSLSELAYRTDGGSGLNTALRPARSNSAEVGARLHRGGQSLSLAVFASRTRDELVVASNNGGRSTYANAATSDRSGWELSASGPLATRWDYAIAYSRLDARYANAFTTCRAPPCARPDTVVASGNRIPATAPRSAWAQLRWHPRAGVDWFVQGSAVGRIHADDANTSWAPGHATLDVGVERRWTVGGLSVQGFARVDNILDRRSVGSVIVNDSNGRYFEPAPGRGWTLAVSLQRAQADP
ncbi:TonB-dependent receptor family protein [Cognatiluteimonas profundi]|uniref:TonB-dependent receptor family protein n=1 Tax=Cognatiluteimonas profundi TaxID=2594501 RepID=UPI00131B50BD|nr:TonB-dependent receptor [Lysobacter profundi]